MIGPLRKVFRKTADGEEGPLDLLAIKAGDTFRMEPACKEDNAFCPQGWMIAKSDGYLIDGVQGIVIEDQPIEQVSITIPIEEPCKTN